MRAQILRLPDVVVGDTITTPFVLVLDEVGEEQLTDPETAAIAAAEMGAVSVIVSEHRVEVV